VKAPKTVFFVTAAALGLAACAQVPTAPNVAVMPAPNKPFAVFRADDAACRRFAHTQVAGARGEAGNRAVGSAVAGTALGAAAGALLGRSGESAAAGAGAGLLFGSAAGAGAANETAMTLQRRYDIAYEQCMYAKGNQVPGYGWRSSAPAGPPPPDYPPPAPPPAVH